MQWPRADESSVLVLLPEFAMMTIQSYTCGQWQTNRETPFSLEAIYTNKDPFDCDRDTANRTKTYYELENDTPKISRDQAMQIETSIKDEEFRSDLLLQFGIAQGKGRSLDTFYELKEFYLESCLKQIQEKNLS